MLTCSDVPKIYFNHDGQRVTTMAQSVRKQECSTSSDGETREVLPRTQRLGGSERSADARDDAGCASASHSA